MRSPGAVTGAVTGLCLATMGRNTSEVLMSGLYLHLGCVCVETGVLWE